MTKYGPIATPYCEEEQIAFVAQELWTEGDGLQVRNNPLTKVYLCQTLGYDSRLKGSCAGYGPDSYAPAVKLLETHARRSRGSLCREPIA